MGNLCSTQILHKIDGPCSRLAAPGFADVHMIVENLYRSGRESGNSGGCNWDTGVHLRRDRVRVRETFGLRRLREWGRLGSCMCDTAATLKGVRVG